MHDIDEAAVELERIERESAEAVQAQIDYKKSHDVVLKTFGELKDYLRTPERVRPNVTIEVTRRQMIGLPA